ncbi:hypothetical protein V6615_00545 [Oscillospiraceae bacterium PP1C4]
MSRKYRQKASKSGLFLMELIIAILFFAFASAICIQLFAKAHLISVNSSDLTMTMSKVQTAAESFKSSDGTPAHLGALLNAQQDGNILIIRFDRQWNETTADTETAYRMTIQVNAEDSVSCAQIQMEKTGQEQPLYEMNAKKYVPHD